MEKIQCPHCGNDFNVEKALSGKLEAQFKAQYEQNVAAQTQKFKLQQEKLDEEKQLFLKNKENENELFRQRLEKQILAEREKFDKSLLAEKEKIELKTNEQYQQQLKQLQEDNEKKKEENRHLKQLEITLKQQQNQLKEQSEDLELKLQKKFLDQQKELEDKARKKERESFEMEKLQLLKQIDDNKKLAEEMKRKAEQGSMQLQGEVQELAIEDWLRTTFPYDTIEEIKKGAKGGDCLQIVHTRTTQNCGIIYYESKRTKDFQNIWIEKFKTDIREKGANIGVLVTEVMPNGMERMGLRDGVWVCNFDEFKGLSAVLRDSIIHINNAIATQENKGDKMLMLYDYLTSPTFKMQIEAIVEGFTAMKIGLEKEKMSMQKIWKEREKQIEKVVFNTIDLYGSVKGIAGNSVLSIKALELDNEEDFEN